MKIVGISKKQRKLIIYDERQYYDGKDYYDTDKEEIKRWSFTNSYKSKYIPIKKDENKTFEECFTEFVEKANTLRTLSLIDGKNAIINLYKTGSDTQTAKTMFYDYCNSQNIKPDPITALECTFIKKASIGALIYSNNDYEGPAYEYDFNSMYPSIMRDDKFKIPIKEGVIKTLSKEEFENMKSTFFCYGIYRCKITSIKPNTTDRQLIRFNHENYYTTQDLRLAKTIGLQIDIIEEDNNMLYYSKDALISGKKLFSYYVDTLYELKKKDKRFKLILNCLWGLLCKDKKTTLRIDLNADTDIDLNTDEVVILSQIIQNNKLIIEYEYITKSSYVCDFARMKPFILSSARLKLSSIINPYVDNIQKIHTDGILSDIKLDVVLGDKIGDLRFDGYRENVKIFNVNKVVDI